jgi:hypothetical protein
MELSPGEYMGFQSKLWSVMKRGGPSPSVSDPVMKPIRILTATPQKPDTRTLESTCISLVLLLELSAIMPNNVVKNNTIDILNGRVNE